MVRTLARDPAPAHLIAVPLAPVLLVSDPALIRQALLVDGDRWARVPGGLGEGALSLSGGGAMHAGPLISTLIEAVDVLAERWEGVARAGGTVELLWELGASVLSALVARRGATLGAVEARAWIDAARAAEDLRFPKAMALTSLLGWLPSDQGRRLAEADIEVARLRGLLGEDAGLAAFIVHGVSLAVAATLMGLAKAPPLEAGVRSELKRLGRDAEPSDIAALPGLRGLMRETLRLHPPAWAVERRSLHDGELAGHKLRAQSRVIFCPWLANRRPAEWPDPEKFDSERHRGPTLLSLWGGALEAHVGEAIAEPLIVLTLARLLRRFRFKQLAGNPLVVTARLRLRIQNAVKMDCLPAPR